MRRKLKATLILVASITTIITFNLLYSANHNPFLEKDGQEINTSNVSAQKLFDTTWQTIKNEYVDSTFNDQYWNRWKDHYKGKLKTDDDAKVAIETMLESLNDPYSRFLTKSEFAEQNTNISSKISGIGVNIVNESGKTKIISVMENSPAQYADLRPNDIMTSVNGIDIKGLSLAEVSNLVKGPINTIVDIDILRNNEPINKKIIRKEITIKTVKSSIIDNIGYIQISSFISSSTPNEFIQALEDTTSSKGLIIDLRGNTGGLLPNAIFISNLFIPKGKIVSIVGRNNYHYDIMAENSEITIKKPVIILVDEASASASEIFSGAMKDHKKAKLLGTKTFGKGMVQKIIPLPNKTGLNLTIAKYLTPNGQDINKKGIEPDYKSILTKEDILSKKDSQLEDAKKLLAKMIN